MGEVDWAGVPRGEGELSEEPSGQRKVADVAGIMSVLPRLLAVMS